MVVSQGLNSNQVSTGRKLRDFPYCPVVKNPQCRGQGLDPWSGKIPHDLGQQSLRAITTEPVL